MWFAGLGARCAGLRFSEPHSVTPPMACERDFALPREPTKGPVENRSLSLNLLFQTKERQFAVRVQCPPDRSGRRANFLMHA